MAKLHELLAVEADLTNTANKLMEEANTTFIKKPDHFTGFTKETKYLDERRSLENTTENKQLVTTVDDKLDYALSHAGKMYDALLQKEATNQTAKADLIVDGKTIAKDIPSTFLLGMESRLKIVRALVEGIPTLPPAIEWRDDINAGKGRYRNNPVATFKTEKKVEFVTLAPATDKHPAQVKDWTADVNVARVDTTTFSGMWSTQRKADVLDRIDTLAQAVKQARQRANMAEVVPVKIGAALLDFILAPAK